ncbi:MAG: hypothetical protein M3Z23_04605, partial [Acidobacteriota bacterium]|nr:hypothetical protein [Acidobacteriota bacterium]
PCSDHGSVIFPADYLRDRNDDVFGSTGKALDEPVTFAMLGTAGKLDPAMFAVIHAVYVL